MQEFQKVLKEFMDKMCQLVWPDNRRDQKWNAMERELKLAIWNANGLAKYSQEIKAFILSQNTDILLLSEIHFTNKGYHLHIPGYTLYHTMHPDGKTYGGTALIITLNIMKSINIKEISCRP